MAEINLIADSVVQSINARKLNEKTCQKFGYSVGTYKGRPCQIATYCDKEGNPVAQKLRFKDKDFKFIGKPNKASFFGSHLWSSGKKIVVTEGEIDALTVSQVQDNKWPVVSIPTGSDGAYKTIKANLEYFNNFEEVILMFDMDDAGRKAVAECAPLFPVGKCKIASLPYKDANECLLNGEAGAIVSAIWNAKEYRPDGLVSVSDIIGELCKPVAQGLPWFSDTLTKLTFGRRYGELYGFGAGTGIGKTDFLTQQIAYDMMVLKQKVGTIFLEQKPVETTKRIAGKVKSKRFHVPDGSWTTEELEAAAMELNETLTMYDAFGQTDWDVVKDKVRFMAVAQDIRIFYIDHLTAMADTADERGSLEQIMKEMAGLANELQVIIHFVSHLATPDGKPHEEGGQVSIRHFKGARAIGFWSYFMFGLERDQQHENPAMRSITTLRVLKDRYTGQATGNLIYFGYIPTEGRLFETELPTEGDDTPFQDETEDF